jgi:hypothetical protein
MGINSESETAASLQIGPTTLGMVRIYLEGRRHRPAARFRTRRGRGDRRGTARRRRRRASKLGRRKALSPPLDRLIKAQGASRVMPRSWAEWTTPRSSS